MLKSKEDYLELLLPLYLNRTPKKMKIKCEKHFLFILPFLNLQRFQKQSIRIEKWKQRKITYTRDSDYTLKSSIFLRVIFLRYNTNELFTRVRKKLSGRFFFPPLLFLLSLGSPPSPPTFIPQSIRN